VQSDIKGVLCTRRKLTSHAIYVFILKRYPPLSYLLILSNFSHKSNTKTSNSHKTTHTRTQLSYSCFVVYCYSLSLSLVPSDVRETKQSLEREMDPKSWKKNKLFCFIIRWRILTRRLVLNFYEHFCYYFEPKFEPKKLKRSSRFWVWS
jgi:hypothetical protein